MTEIKYIFFINQFEGLLRQKLEFERQKLYKVQRRLSGALYLKATITRDEYLENMHRLKLIKILLSQLIRTLGESDK